MAESPPRPTALRPFWSGTVSFGLAAIPVELFTAVRRRPTRLRMATREGHPVVRRYTCPVHDRPLDSDEIVRGIAVEDGWVTVEDEELEALQPDKTREIDLRRFVPADAIHPARCDRPYLLLPASGITKAYRLLAEALEEDDLAGIASFVLRGREHLVAILAHGGVLRAETLRRDDELRSAEEVGLEVGASPSDDEVDAVIRAMEALEDDTLPLEDLQDERARRLAALVAEAPALEEGDESAEDEDDEDAGGGQVVDIMDLLEERLGVAS
jgi:DNA end-binding protein Ku